MSDNIPFEIQMEIIKWLPVKPLIQFRSVSKPWKSFIDTSDFIKGYGARHTQPRSRILSYKSDIFQDEANYICVIDDDNNETFKVQQQVLAPFVVPPLLKNYGVYKVVGACHGLLCLYGTHQGYRKWMIVIWNPSIGKSFAIALPSLYSMPQGYAKAYIPNQPGFGFGVCPVTRDPTLVKIIYVVDMPWHVEVFTLSSGVRNVIPIGNLPHQSIKINMSTHVALDRFIYWGASDMTYTDAKYIVVSFDLITKEFKVVDLPDSLTNELNGSVSVSKLRDSLVVYGGIRCGVWVMEHDSSFRKLFTIGAPVSYILGFRKSGEPIFETQKNDEIFTTLDVYDPLSQQIKNLGISGVRGSFFMDSYKESLLLLDHSDSHIYSDDS